MSGLVAAPEEGMKTLLAIGSVLMLSSATVLADAVPTDPELLLPPECMPYSAAPVDIESVATWNQVLSFAACVQDVSMESIDDPDQLPALMAGFELALVPTVALYVSALQYGPAAIQLRAAFQIGMVHVAMITRARASLAGSLDRSTNRAAAARYRELQQRLEPLLEDSARLAWALFAMIDRVAADDPSVASDEVTRNMVRASRELERTLRWSVATPETETPSRPLIATH